jgi:hypothetical protein
MIFGKSVMAGPVLRPAYPIAIFKLYALDAKLNLASGATKKQVERAEYRFVYLPG